LLEFVLNSFRKWFVALLWIAFIGCILAGIILGWNIGPFIFVLMGLEINPIIGEIVGVLLGAGLGLLLGAFVIIIGGGLIAIFLNIDEKINDMSNELVKIGKMQGELHKIRKEQKEI
jgi:uncharacterized membrane protein (DUF106 family)